MAVLVLTNAQWQEQQQHEALIQQEELRRRQMEEEAKARMEAQNRLVASIKQDAPWYYSDPQNNIQVRNCICDSFSFFVFVTCGSNY